MVATVQTFSRDRLPVDFGSEGRIRFIKDFTWGWKAKDRTNLDPGIAILPQTSGYFCLIDDPRHNGSGVRKYPGSDMAQFNVIHGDGTVTYGNMGARLYWANCSIPPGAKLQFHYIFLRGEWNNPRNAFAQFLAVADDGTVIIKRKIAQTCDAGPSESGKYYRWRAFGPIEFAHGFSGALQWIVSNGQRCNTGDAHVDPDTDLYPSALALDFISIIT